MTTKTADEIAIMTPDEIRAWREAEMRNVFGHDVKFDANGRPIETGIGSAGNETESHFAALEKYEGKAVADRARAAAEARRKA